MKPIFIQFTTPQNDEVNININNILYVSEMPNETEIVLIGDINLRVKDSFAEVNEAIDKAIEHADSYPNS